MNDTVRSQEIPIVKIKIVDNHRTNIEKTHLDELMQSIKQHGLMQPVGVAKNGKSGYVLRFGQRRFLACKKLGYKTITAMVSNDAGVEKLLVENLTENMQRKDPSFAEFGRVINKLERMNLSVKEISARLGLPMAKINQIVSVYHALPEKYRKRVVFMEKGGGRKTRKGCLPAQVATKIVSMKKDHGLSDKSIDHLFKAATDEGMDALDFNNFGHLMNSGMSAEEALKNVRAYGVFTVEAVVKHSEVEERMEKHGLVSRKHFFSKIIYGEIPPLIKPDFLSTGTFIVKEEPKAVDLKPFEKMLKQLAVAFRSGFLTEAQYLAFKSLIKVKPKEWTEAQQEQIRNILKDVEAANGK
jgi:ParB/RepB/Spo0J family partition protein